MYRRFGTHIPVKAPEIGHADFSNRKGWSSVILQGLVDSNYLFMDICCKHPGSVHDATVFKDSELFNKLEILQQQMPKITLNELDIPAFIIGDPAYPLMPWLIKGYVGQKSAKEESFNVYLNKAMVVVENAFGRLKGRWRVLIKALEVDMKLVPKLVETCCVLHNICVKHKVPYNEKWSESLQETNQFEEPSTSENLESSLDGETIREYLKFYIAQHYPLLKGK